MYRVVNIFRDDIGVTCNHCSRGIKNIATVEDVATRERMNVGLTCLDKILNVKTTFIDRVKKESNKYYSLAEKIEKLIIEISKEDNDYNREIKITWLIQSKIKLINQIELMNNLGTKGYIKIENVDSLKNEVNRLCEENGYKKEY